MSDTQNTERVPTAGAKKRRRLTDAERAERIERLLDQIDWCERRIRCLPSPMTTRRLFGLADFVEACGRRAATAERRRFAVSSLGSTQDADLAWTAVQLGMLRRALARAGG
jgi:hypothetical protein